VIIVYRKDTSSLAHTHLLIVMADLPSGNGSPDPVDGHLDVISQDTPIITHNAGRAVNVS
jgi:hypothetical protein